MDISSQKEPFPEHGTPNQQIEFMDQHTQESKNKKRFLNII